MKITFLSFSAFFLTLCSALYGSLGDKLDSVHEDGKILKGKVQVLRPGQSKAFRTDFGGLFSVYEIEADGVVVREYISRDGIVFGVAWQGLAHPDLKQLLGKHHEDFQKAEKNTPRRLGMKRRAVGTSDLRVERWGHQRNLRGRAVRMSLLPTGVSLDAVQ